jgi:NADPH:quinone reductase-like Zn-dependent oxidoreductase
VELALAARGTLENLQLRPAARRAPGAGEVELQVLAAGLNFRDVLNALGMYPGDPGPLGNECVGIVTQVGAGVNLAVGQQLAGMVVGAFRTYVTADARLLAPVAAGLTTQEAATVPIAFMTAVHALDDLAKLAPGQRVLIHAGAGGVGLAAIQVAQRIGAEVFATADSPEKREYLRSIGVPHVLDSRSLSFATEIAKLTGGAGVHVVLNSLAGEFISASMGTLASGGVFIELGKTGIMTAEQAAATRPDISYYAVYLGDLAPAALGDLLARINADLAARRYRPLPFTTFDLGRAQAAFRYMAQARHIGKVVLTQVRQPGVVRPDATYLVTGGMSGVGLKVVEWLAARGAKHIVAVGRRAPSAAARTIFDGLAEGGARVVALQADVGRAPGRRSCAGALDHRGGHAGAARDLSCRGRRR